MTGKHVQDLIISEGYSVNQIAKLIGVAQPNLLALLRHDDIRTGLLEDIAKAMGKPLSFFYGEAFGSVSVASGERATSVQVGGDATNVATSADDRLLTLLLSKDEQLTMAMNQTSKAQQQMDRTQSHMERILDKFCEVKNK